MADRVDVLVIGAGPGGSTAARMAAAQGLHVLLIERRRRIGLPVQCAEYVPAQIVAYAPVPERCIAQRIRSLRTHLADGQSVESPAAGYILNRAEFDKALAVAAHRTGAELWTGARAVKPTERGALVRHNGQVVEIECRVLIGADGPHSTVGRWIGQTNTEFIDALQVEVVLSGSQESTQVFFDPIYRGGYGWLFPKGETANVGVGVSRRLGGDPQQALDHLLERLEFGRGAIVGRSGGPVPSGGPVARIRVGEALLVGDAAGHTHPVTGAGILAAVVGGTLAGQTAAKFIKSNDHSALDEYEREWASFMGGPLRHALGKRRYLDQHWSDDPVALSRTVRDNWVAFKAYGQPRPDRGK